MYRKLRLEMTQWGHFKFENVPPSLQETIASTDSVTAVSKFTKETVCRVCQVSVI